MRYLVTAWLLVVLCALPVPPAAQLPESNRLRLSPHHATASVVDLVWQRRSVRPAVPTGPLRQGWYHVVFQTPAIGTDVQRLI